MRAPGSPASGLQICTIVARNYLPAARVLASSFLAHNPDGAVSVLVIDDVHGVVDRAREPFEVIDVGDLFSDPAELHRMATIYELTEFATSVKPWLLEHLLDRGNESVLYLDPDIEVFDRLDDLARIARQAGIALIPHARAPFPRDQKMTSESAILAVGVYNLGFIGVGQKARPFLDYWKERLRRESRNDPGNMRFVDQRWVDFVPGMFDCGIVRDPRWNVAYWNLHEREVNWTGGRYEVEGEQLGFFHFSGYSPSARHILSSHQVDRPRILLSEHPDLVKIFNEYGDALEKAGFGSDSVDTAGEYGLSRALNGVALDRHVRKVYLEHLLAWEDGKEAVPPPDPFDPVGAKELLEWLNSIAPSSVGPSRLTLYQATLYAHEPELHSRFPDPQGADFERFQHWLALQAKAGRVDPLLVPPYGERAGTVRSDPGVEANGPEAVWARGSSLVPGMTVVGYVNAEHSIGELGRLAAAGVRAAGIPFQLVAFEPAEGHANLSRVHAPGSVARGDYDTNLVVVNADQFADFADAAGPGLGDGRYTIGQWAWELETFPHRWHRAFEAVDEIWAISEFTRRAIAGVTAKPVIAVPPAVLEPEIQADLGRSWFGLPEDRFVFLFCFDFASVVGRKNPVGLIKSFSRAFTEGEGPILVVKSVNGDSKPMDQEMVRLAAGGRSDIVFIDRSMAAGELGALMEAADCYASLHRSEGFGLTMAESMILGKPVIATVYSGNLEFMTEQNSFLIPFSWGEVPRGADPYPAGARWAEPDLDVAASVMRTVSEDSDLAARVALKGQSDLREHHGVEKRAELMKKRFGTIGSTRPTDHRPSAADESGGIPDLVRRGVRRVRQAGLGRRTAELDRAVEDLGVQLDGLRNVRAAADTRQSDHEARLEVAVRDIGRRLGSLERRLESLERFGSPDDSTGAGSSGSADSTPRTADPEPE